MSSKHIVIVGAGFGGLRLARQLNNHPNYHITLIDRNNFHQFQPLFYQVATANLDASNISFPLRSIFKNSKNVTIRIADLNSIDSANNQILTSIGTIIYEYLVIATGADTNFYGNEGLKTNAFPMKSTIEALQLRNQIIKNFEDASVSDDTQIIEKLLTIVIIGGGPTGVELAGALAEMKQEKIPKEYPELKINHMKIYLLEGGNKLLSNMSEVSSKTALSYLLKMGVIVKTNTLVKEYIESDVLLSDGGIISSSMVIWAAGVTGNLPSGINKEFIASGNRIEVDGLNKVAQCSNIFAIGDIAFQPSSLYPKGLPQVANVAIDQATNLAANFKNIVASKKLKPYRYNNKGTMATVGRNKAVVDLAAPNISFQGFFAWMVWMGLHLLLLIGFKNRIIVFVNWIFKYFTRNQSLSLLFKPLLRERRS
ncbi:MAG: NAD(P)/FAD-dependent oxidoreductase [Bacteroidia bacterium]